MIEGTNKALGLEGKLKDPNAKDGGAGGAKATKQADAQEEEKLVDDKNMLNFLMGKMKEMETEYDTVEHLVIDMGNAYTKIGFSGEDLPRIIIPSIFASLKEDNQKTDMMNLELKPYLFGEEALGKSTEKDYEKKQKNREREEFEKIKEYYRVKHLNPCDHKAEIHENFKDFLKEILENRMGIIPSDYSVLITGSPIKHQGNIKHLATMIFDELQFKSFSLINSSSLSLFSTGRTSGLVLECGETKTFTVPIFEGFPLYHALNKTKLGGRNVTELLVKEINTSGIGLSLEDQLLSCRAIKEKMSVVSDYDIEHYLNSNEDVIREERMLYKMPDEEIIRIPKKARLMSSEFLFTPSIYGYKEKGLVSLVADSLTKCYIDDDEIKKIMYSNIVLSGGTTMMSGFSDRIKRDLGTHVEGKDIDLYRNAQIIAEGNRNIAPWIGGSMIASMSSFSHTFINREEFGDASENKFPNMFQKIF